MKKLVAASVILSLAGCGGGGGSSPSTTSSNTVTTLSVVPEKKYFNEKVDAFPDLRPYFDQLCGNDTVVGHFYPVDINSDGLKDIVMSLSCNLNGQLVGTAYNGSVRNTLIILRQKSDNTFYVANQEYFGKDIVALSGAGTIGMVAVGDFNKDGKLDIALAFQKEDGRAYVQLSNGTTTWDAHPQVLMSTSKGLELQTLPYYFTNNYVKVVKNQDGIDEIVVGGYKFTYVKNEWVLTGDYNWVDRSATPFKTNGKEYMFTQYYNTLGSEYQLGFMLSRQSTNGYVTTSKLSLGKLQTAKYYDPRFGQYGYETKYLINLKGEYWLTPSIADSCYVETKNNITTMLVMFEGYKLKGYNEGQLLTFDVDFKNYDYVGKLLKVTIEGETVKSFDWVGDAITYNLNIGCQDLDNDSNGDFFVNRWLDNTYNPLKVTQNPYVYYYNAGYYYKVDDAKFPVSPSYYRGQLTHFADMNGDGKLDLIYYPTAMIDSSYKGPVKLQLYNGDKPLNQ